MVVEAGKIVAIYYVMKVRGVARSIRSPLMGDPPLEYVHGAGQLIPGLERALEGRSAGEHVRVVVPPSEAYGERLRSLQQRVPLDALADLGPLEEGMILEAVGEDGTWRELLTVVEIDHEQQTVLLDANHPLAGLELEFEVDVVDVRDPVSKSPRRLSEPPMLVQARPRGRRPDPLPRAGPESTDRD